MPYFACGDPNGPPCRQTGGKDFAWESDLEVDGYEVEDTLEAPGLPFLSSQEEDLFGFITN